MVPGRGLEPPRIAPRGPKPRASTNFATPAGEVTAIESNTISDGIRTLYQLRRPGVIRWWKRWRRRIGVICSR